MSPKLKTSEAGRARRKPGPRAGGPASKDGFRVPNLTKIEQQRERDKKREKKLAQCNAKTRGGGKCMKSAGWGTSHPGIGKCKLHAGSVPSHIKAAASEEHRRMLGVKREISPEDALLECIQIRAGEITWLSERMAKLQEKDFIEETMLGKQFHLYARERQAAMRDLARFSQMAIQMNIEERRVRIAETYGETLANLLRGILDELMPHLDKIGREEAPQIVRRHLIALNGGKQQLELPEKVA